MPALPHPVSRAIDAISYGHLEKVYVAFPCAFWEGGTGQESREPGHERRADDGESLNARVDMTPGMSGSAHWNHPTYAGEHNPLCWNQTSISLAGLPVGCGHSTMLFYIHGPCSLHLTSLLSHTPVSSHRSHLTAFFEPYYSRLPNYSASSPSCTPVSFTHTSWSTDEFAGWGSYSNFQIGLGLDDKADRCIETMRDSTGEHMGAERRLWLAGEHTAPFEALGTVTGAYLSGSAVGEKVASLYEMGER